MRHGVLPSQKITDLVRSGFIGNGKEENVCTDTYDVVPDSEVYRLPGAFLPRSGEQVMDFIRSHGKKVHPDSTLERGVCYIWRLRESIKKTLPDNVFGYSNPKSNIGRVDVLTRILADGVPRYDYIPPGYVGPLWTMTEPKSFAVVAKEEISFNQIRFLNRETRLEEFDLGLNFDGDGGMLFDRDGKQILYENMDQFDRDGSILLTLGFDFQNVGYQALATGEPIDLSLKDHYDPKEFFKEICPMNGSINFKENSFNILSSDESVRVPNTLACEMRPMDERSGEFRTHYAGYIAPGWGMGADSKGKGKPLTLEARFYSEFTVRKSQPFAKIRFEHMIVPPDVHYDQQPNIKFKIQTGPGLAKYFKEW